MRPQKFAEQTIELKKPASMADDECGPLPIFCDGEQCVSCWRPSLRERLSILFFGRVWLCVMSGRTQPPVWIAGRRELFETTAPEQLEEMGL